VGEPEWSILTKLPHGVLVRYAVLGCV